MSLKLFALIHSDRRHCFLYEYFWEATSYSLQDVILENLTRSFKESVMITRRLVTDYSLYDKWPMALLSGVELPDFEILDLLDAFSCRRHCARYDLDGKLTNRLKFKWISNCGGRRQPAVVWLVTIPDPSFSAMVAGSAPLPDCESYWLWDDPCTKLMSRVYHRKPSTALLSRYFCDSASHLSNIITNQQKSRDWLQKTVAKLLREVYSCGWIG